jgi:hypothetical protein
VGSWYWIGVSLGLGTSVGVLLAGAMGIPVRAVLLMSVVAAALAGAAIGFGIDEWQPGGWGDVVAGAIGALVGLICGATVVAGALRRGGTRGGTGTLVGGGALVLAGAAFIPVVGYLEVFALPTLAARLRRAQPKRYAGLRTLARDE